MLMLLINKNKHITLYSLNNFTQLWGYPKNGCWGQAYAPWNSHSTHYNSCGYDLISLAADLWHHTAALKPRTAALGPHIAALKDKTDWDVAEVFTLSCCMCHTTQCNPHHGYVRFRIVLICNIDWAGMLWCFAICWVNTHISQSETTPHYRPETPSTEIPIPRKTQFKTTTPTPKPL